MSNQCKLLENVIGTAQDGNEAAIDLLRTICREAIALAPVPALIQMGQQLLSIGIEASKVESQRN